MAIIWFNYVQRVALTASLSIRCATSLQFGYKIIRNNAKLFIYYEIENNPNIKCDSNAIEILK